MNMPSAKQQSTAGQRDATLVFLPEPGSCAGRLDPQQTVIPPWLAQLVDFHVWPSASPWALADYARTVCAHIDYGYVAERAPELFRRRGQVGPPALDELWAARSLLADNDVALALDVQFELYDGELALAVYGAGVAGRLEDALWREVSAHLTTCAAMVREPRDDLAPDQLVRPARPASAAGRRDMPGGVYPLSWEVGDWLHTWWGYPLHGRLTEGCTCSAHTTTASAVHFGPDVGVGA